MAPQKVRVGIIGTGFGADVQLPAFLGLKDAEVVAIASSDPKRSLALQKKFKLPMAFESYDALLECDEIDLVSIATAPMHHEHLVRKAIEMGKNILCEKPFTMSSNVAKNLLKEANAAHIIHATDFGFRDTPALQFFVSRLMAGVTGRIVFGELRWTTDTWSDPKRSWDWHCDRAQGGGVLGAFGVHLYNIAESILGSLSKIQAEAHIATPERKDDAGEMKPVTSENSATIDLQGQYGIPVRIAISNVDAEGTGFGISVRGEKGVLLLESVSQEYGSRMRVREGTSPAASKVVYEDPKPPAGVDGRIAQFQPLAARLLAAIQAGDRTFAPSFQDGVRAQMFLEAVRESADTRSSVNIGKTL